MLMGFNNLRERHHLLITFMQNAGYSKGYIKNVRKEIKRILTKSEINNWHNYSDVLNDYEQRLSSTNYLLTKRYLLGLIEYFDVYERYPNGMRRNPQNHKYDSLNNTFKKVISEYVVIAKNSGIKETTVYSRVQDTTNFLLHLQEMGCDSFRDVTEKAVLSAFVSKDGTVFRGYGSRNNIAAVLKAYLSQNHELFARVLSFLPEFKNSRKNVQYLSHEEILKIKQILNNESSPLSFRDRAIGILALYTGLRRCDIAGLMFDSIDWESDFAKTNNQQSA